MHQQRLLNLDIAITFVFDSSSNSILFLRPSAQPLLFSIPSPIPLACLVFSPSNLTRRRSLERVRDLRLPSQPVLTVDLYSDLEALGALQQAGSHDNVVAHDGLVVVRVGGAVGAVVAVDRIPYG